MRAAAVLAALGLATAGCGESSSQNTTEYQNFLAGQFKIAILSGGKLRGTVVVDAPAPRSGTADDFCELFVNGKKLGRFSLSESDDPLEFSGIKLRSGVNRIAIWDSASNRGHSESLDSRAGTLIEIRITEDGVEMIPSPE